MDIRKTVKIEPGHYVVAVSGGVDSMVLLDILVQLAKRAEGKGQSKSGLNTHPSPLTPHLYSFTVAHFDHGIRPDSKADRLLVEWVAKLHGVPFIYAIGELEPGVSEEKARDARYAFLRKVQKQTGATGIITAHHMNDVLETATHNILRGTGRKGMSSLKSVDGIIRPLLHLPKDRLIAYATANNLPWHEDTSNSDVRYRRNYIRQVILPKLQAASPEKYKRLSALIKRQADLNRAIDSMIGTILHTQPSTTTLRRGDVIGLPHAVARELVGEWLRLNGKREFSRKQLERATIALKTGRPKTVHGLDKKYRIELDSKHAHLVNL